VNLFNKELTCSKCQLTKPTTEFYRRYDGYSPYYFPKCKLCQNERSNELNRRRRIKVLKYYGGDPPRCACCGETNNEFLCMDHENGGGEQHRRDTNCGTGSTFCSWLIRNNYPVGYRVLCQNCNSAFGFYGYCPHQKKKEEILSEQ
jgi:hypothetical protein